MNKIRVNIMLDKDQLFAMKAQAKRRRTTLSFEIRQLIDAQMGRSFGGERDGFQVKGRRKK